MGILKSESYKRGVAYSTGFNLLAKLVGFANSMVVAFYFGTQVKTDIYFYSIATISMLMGLVTSLDHSVLIPEAMRIREQEGEKQSQIFFNFFLYIYLFIGLLCVSILYISPVGFFTFVSKFDVVALSNNVTQIYAVIPLCLLMLFVNFLIDIFASYRFFTLPMITALVNSCMSLVFIFFFHNVWDVTSMIVAQIFAYSFNIIWLLCLLKKKIHWQFGFARVRLRSLVWKNMGYSQLGNIFSLIGAYTPMYLLSGFSGGVITCLNYGRNIAELPRQLLINQFSIVSGIKLNELYATNDLENLNLFFLRTVKFMIFIMMPLSGLLFLFSEQIISFLYQRGNFSAESVTTSALFLRYLGLLLPLYAVDTMFARLNMAGQKIKSAFGYQILSNALTVLFAMFFISHVGFIGYPIALILCYLSGLFIVCYIIRKLYSSIEYVKVIRYFFCVLLVNLGVVCIVHCFINIVTLPMLGEVVLGGCLYGIILLLVNHLMKLNSDFTNIVKSLCLRINLIK